MTGRLGIFTARFRVNLDDRDVVSVAVDVVVSDLGEDGWKRLLPLTFTPALVPLSLSSDTLASSFFLTKCAFGAFSRTALVSRGFSCS